MPNSSSLQEFVARHAKPYNPDSDDYDRPPFSADIKEGKNDPIYNAHSYHTKVPPRSIIPYILHYTQPGDLILDPFCGSGMTGVAAQMCIHPPADILDQFPEMNDRVGPRGCILKDLSPIACHIAYNYNTPVDVEALRREFARIKSAVQDEFDWLYSTEHYEPAIGIYDPSTFEAGSRLKKWQTSGKKDELSAGERTWELLNKTQVEARLGYSVSKLSRDERWGGLDVEKVEEWVCIPASIQYTVWSDVYRCEGLVTVSEPTGRISTRGKNADKPIFRAKRVKRGCNHEFTLWDAAVDLCAGVISDAFSCPLCGQRWQKRQLQKLNDVPVLVTYEYIGLVRQKNAVDIRLIRRDRSPTKAEIAHIGEIQSHTITDWYPTQPIDKGREMMRHGMSKQNLSNIGEFWTIRNKRALAKLWSEIKKVQNLRVQSALSFAFTSILFRVSRRRIVYCPKGGGWASTVISGTLYIPSLNAEANVWKSFANKADDVFALALGVQALGNTNVSQGDATDLNWIPSWSIDYIFADPPFGQNIYYADCSLLWEGWLDNFTDEAKEIVVNERRQGGPFKDLSAYGHLMEKSFREMFRVLKPNRFATIEFNNSDGAVFETIKGAATAAGFQIENMLLLDKTGKTYKQMKAVVSGEDVVDKDVLFNLHKPAGARVERAVESQDLEQQITDIVREHLRRLPERIKAEPAKYSEEHRTTATLNSILMNALIPRGVGVERLNLPFIELACRRYFRKVGPHWYLRGETVGGGDRGVLFEEEIEIRSELSAIDWLRQKIKTGPKLIGELKPHWMRAIGLLPSEISQALLLEDLLSENFWRDADTNRWREPSPEEREKMNDDRSLRALHDAERFVNGTLRRPTTDAERADWIDVLFHACRAVEDEEEDALPALRGFAAAEAYVLITRLFQGILRDHLADEAWRKVEKQAAAASRKIAFRTNEQNAKAIKPRGPEGGQEHFDFGKA